MSRSCLIILLDDIFLQVENINIANKLKLTLKHVRNFGEHNTVTNQFVSIKLNLELIL